MRSFFCNHVALLGVIALAGCTTTGPGSQAPLKGYASKDLYVCSSTRISNAPKTDKKGRIIAYSPTISLRGVELISAPVKGCLSSGFGKRRGGAGRIHKGIDLYTKIPKPLVAAGDGVITFIGTQSGYGRLIIINHGNNVTTRYAHLSSIQNNLKIGTKTKLGTIIGKTGRTGNATAVHLHYEILVNEKQRDILGLK